MGVSLLPVFGCLGIVLIYRVRIAEVHHRGFAVQGYSKYEVFDVRVTLGPARVTNPNNLDKQ